MNVKYILLFVVVGLMNLIPFSASAFTYEDLADAVNSRRACPVEDIK